MKHGIVIIFLMSLVTKVHSQGQCPDCQVALIKDQFASSESSYEKLNILSIIDKENFEIMKKKTEQNSGGGLEIFDVFGFSASSSKTYEEFSEKREKYFQKNEFSSTKKWNKDVNTVGTSPIAYKAYSDCIKLCYANNPNLTAVFGYVEYEDSLQSNIKVKYQANGLSKDSVRAHFTVDNATIIYDGDEDNGDWDITFQKNEEVELIVKRKDKFKVATLIVRAEGGNVFQYASTFERKKVPIKYKCKLSFSKEVTNYVFVRTERVAVRSPEMHEQPGNAKNTLILPNLSGGERYRNFSGVGCSVDNQGACAWNYSSGFFNPVTTINGDSTSAKVEFNTASRSCEWFWKADVYKPQIQTTPNEIEFDIKSKSWTFKLPITFKKGIGDIDMYGESILFEIGKNDPNSKIQIVSKTEDGFYYYFNYVLN